MAKELPHERCASGSLRLRRRGTQDRGGAGRHGVLPLRLLPQLAGCADPRSQPVAHAEGHGDKLGVYKRSEASHRHFCTECGAPVLIRHPELGLTDVPAGSVSGLPYAPTMHVHYGEKVLSVRDGLPKHADMPSAFGGSGQELPE